MSTSQTFDDLGSLGDVLNHMSGDPFYRGRLVVGRSGLGLGAKKAPDDPTITAGDESNVGNYGNYDLAAADPGVLTAGSAKMDFYVSPGTASDATHAALAAAATHPIDGYFTSALVIGVRPGDAHCTWFDSTNSVGGTFSGVTTGAWFTAVIEWLDAAYTLRVLDEDAVEVDSVSSVLAGDNRLVGRFQAGVGYSYDSGSQLPMPDPGEMYIDNFLFVATGDVEPPVFVPTPTRARFWGQ